MKRTPLSERRLPRYTRGEERFHMISHIVGGGFGVAVLICCIAISLSHRRPCSMVSSVIYGGSLIALYTMSSLYHGLPAGTGKKVLQILDHCTIYLLIAGTYTPVVLVAIRPAYPVWGWTLFALVWGLAAVGATFTAIDLKKYSVLSMICYLGMGWCIVIALRPTLASVPLPALLWILAGGIAYTVGAVLYGLGKRHRFVHGVFHIFVLIASVFQFIGIADYIL